MNLQLWSPSKSVHVLKLHAVCQNWEPSQSNCIFPGTRASSTSTTRSAPGSATPWTTRVTPTTLTSRAKTYTLPYNNFSQFSLTLHKGNKYSDHINRMITLSVIILSGPPTIFLQSSLLLRKGNSVRATLCDHFVAKRNW